MAEERTPHHSRSEMRYGLVPTLCERDEAIAQAKEEAGCFVLLTNVPPEGPPGSPVAYDGKTILEAYKDQPGIERNFGFLKDPVIVNSLFLKRPERIEALGLILLIALLLWRLMERAMRRHVTETQRPLMGWDHRPTERPTAFMMTTKFDGGTPTDDRSTAAAPPTANRGATGLPPCPGACGDHFHPPAEGARRPLIAFA